MEEIRLRDEQLSRLADSAAQLLAGLRQSKRQQQDLDLVRAQLSEMSTALLAFKLELKAQAPSDKQMYKPKKRAHKQKLEELTAALTSAEIEFPARDELLADTKAKVVDYQSNAGLMARGTEVLADSKASLERSRDKIYETIKIGEHTAIVIQESTERMEGMINKLDEMESNLNRASKIIRDIARRIATDKIVWMLIVLITCLIIFIVLYRKRTDSGGAVDQLVHGR